MLMGLGTAAQEEAGATPGPQPGEEKTFLGIEFVWCPAGTYQQGSEITPDKVAVLLGGRAEWFVDEHPQHQVTITKGFWLSKYEITRQQWTDRMQTQPWERFGSGGEDALPATGITWTQSQEFAQKLTIEGKGVFRLPTEAEWEYACRAGTDSLFPFGDEAALLSEYVNCRMGDVTADVAPVGQKKPNAWGLFDLLGNVWEWCDDLYAPYDDPSAKVVEEYRVVRGGSVNSTAAFLRCAYRLGMQTGRSTPRLGVRVAREP